MRLRVLARRLSLEGGLVHAGDEVSLPDEQAYRLVELGLAEAVAAPATELVKEPEPEAAALAEPPENAALPKGKKRG